LEKKFYSLKELSPLTNIKYRQLQEKIKVIREKYVDRNDLIYKKSNKWFIHCSLVGDFTRTKYPIDYKLFVTIASKNQFDVEYWKFFICHLNKTLKKINTSTRIKYVIEKTTNNVNHLHFMTSFGNLKMLRKIIQNDDITNNSNDMNTNIKNVFEISGLHKYFRKQNKPVLLK